MTVIAWDGKTLAADKRASTSGAIFTVTKIFQIDGCLVGVSGSMSRAGEYLAWLRNGAEPDKYPKQDSADCLYMLVIRRAGIIERYEETGWPILVEEPYFAAGSGRDFAVAAMHLGCDARRAVEITCAHSHECGNGIDTLTFEDAIT